MKKKQTYVVHLHINGRDQHEINVTYPQSKLSRLLNIEVKVHTVVKKPIVKPYWKTRDKVLSAKFAYEIDTLIRRAMAVSEIGTGFKTYDANYVEVHNHLPIKTFDGPRSKCSAFNCWCKT